MSKAACKAALCVNNLAATSTTLDNRMSDFSDEQLEKIADIAEKANHKLSKVVTTE